MKPRPGVTRKCCQTSWDKFFVIQIGLTNCVPVKLGFQCVKRVFAQPRDGATFLLCPIETVDMILIVPAHFMSGEMNVVLFLFISVRCTQITLYAPQSGAEAQTSNCTDFWGVVSI